MAKSKKKNNKFFDFIKKYSENKAVWAGIITVFITVFLCIILTPRFSLVSNEVTIEAGSEFKPEEYIKSTNQIKISDIEISGEADTSVLGEYKITYSYKSKKKGLIIKVCDTIPPEIIPKKELSFECNSNIEAEMLADIKDATKCELKLDTADQKFDKQGEYTIALTAVDAAGNKSESKIKIEIKNSDVTPPIIKGADNISIIVGTDFDIEKGVTLEDDFDDAPKLSIEKGNFNPKKEGTYTIIYTAEDKSGNKTVLKRTVYVVKKDIEKVFFVPAGGSFGWDAKGIANQPYLVAVNRAMCTITVYAKDSAGNYTVPYKAFVCSVGKDGADNQTPTGRYKTSGRYEWCRMVDNSYGRYAIRIDGPIMFHSVCYFTQNKTNLEYEEYNKLGSPASLGCVRLCLADVKWLYDNCPNGFPVEIYDDNTLSGPLGKPAPIKIDVNNTECRGWDPTDWDSANPWNK